MSLKLLIKQGLNDKLSNIKKAEKSSKFCFACDMMVYRDGSHCFLHCTLAMFNIFVYMAGQCYLNTTPTAVKASPGSNKRNEPLVDNIIYSDFSCNKLNDCVELILGAIILSRRKMHIKLRKHTKKIRISTHKRSRI